MSSRSGYGYHDRERLRVAVLDSDALEPLMRADPERAAELLRLAVVDPLARSRRILGDEGSLHITDAPHWLGPVPERGPFLRFLHLAPQVALELTIEIVEMATERWVEQTSSEMLEPDVDAEVGDAVDFEHADDAASQNRASEPGSFEVLVNSQPVELIGDAQMLQWHRGESRVATVLATMLMAVESWLYSRLDAGEDVAAELGQLLGSRSAALWGLAAEVAAYRPELLRGPLLPLITGGELLIADRSYRDMPHEYLLMAALGDGVWGGRIRSWNGMEHRKRSLLESLMVDVVSGGPLRSELQLARERWAERAPERLKHLLAQTDLANRQLRRVGEDAFMFDYVPPPEVAEEVEESNQQMRSTQLWVMGPYRMRQLVDEDQQLSDEEIEAWWALACGTLAEGMPQDMSLDGVRSAADVECGVAAVLLRCGSAWLERHSEARAWCREHLLAPFAAPPPTHMFDDSNAIDTDSWDAFCADALPRLLVASPADPELRGAIACLAIHRHHATVRRVMFRMAEEPPLAGELRRLEHLALVWARWLAYRHERRSRQKAASYDWAQAPRVEDLPDVETPTREALAAFERGDPAADPPRLAEWIASTPEGLVRTRRGRSRALPVLDADYLLAAFDHLLTLGPGLEGDDLERRLLFAQDLAELIAQGMQPDDRGRLSGTPYQHEYRALDRLGALAVRAPAERAAPIWQPLLAPGAPAEHWVEWFLRALWRAAADVPPMRAGRLMSDMVAFAEKQETWAGPASGRTDIALALVGLDHSGGGVGAGPATAAIVGQAREAWIRWVSRELADPWFAERALRFFVALAAQEILEPMLARLAELESGRRLDPRPRYDEALGEMLAGLMVSRPDLFTAPGAAGEALRLLLSRLAERGSALALELVNQLA